MAGFLHISHIVFPLPFFLSLMPEALANLGIYDQFAQTSIKFLFGFSLLQVMTRPKFSFPGLLVGKLYDMILSSST